MTDRNWRGELAEAIGVDPTAAPAPAPATDERRDGGDRPNPDVEARLARIERLLDADLELLGGAVVAESVEVLVRQLADVRRRVEDAQALASQQLTAIAPPDVAALAETAGELFEISRRVLRRTEVLDKQLAELESSNTAVLRRLDAVGGQVQELLARLEG